MKYILVVSSFILISCKEEVQQSFIDHNKVFLEKLGHDDFDSVYFYYQAMELDSLFEQKYPAIKNNSQLELYFPSSEWKTKISSSLANCAVTRESSDKYAIWMDKKSINTYFIYNYPPDTNIIVLEIFK